MEASYRGPPWRRLHLSGTGPRTLEGPRSVEVVGQATPSGGRVRKRAADRQARPPRSVGHWPGGGGRAGRWSGHHLQRPPLRSMNQRCSRRNSRRPARSLAVLPVPVAVVPVRRELAHVGPRRRQGLRETTRRGPDPARAHHPTAATPVSTQGEVDQPPVCFRLVRS
jgi:hypothetical protein